jgi:hypothetical protein
LISIYVQIQKEEETKKLLSSEKIRELVP